MRISEIIQSSVATSPDDEARTKSPEEIAMIVHARGRTKQAYRDVRSDGTGAPYNLRVDVDRWRRSSPIDAD